MAENVEYVITLRDLFTGTLNKIDGGIDRLENKIGGIQSTFGKFAAAAGGLFAVDKITNFGGQVIDTLAQFEKFEAVLTSTLGSNSAAQAALDQINTFAATTPFQVSELTDSFIKLANRGVVPSMGQMTSMGDVAAILGKDFGQLTEAMLDVSSTERWNELGIKAKAEGDKISLTFRGVTQTVSRSEAGIMEAINAFGQMEGVSGVMDKMAATTGGTLSNLSDEFTQLKLTIGQELRPAISLGIAGLRALIGLFRSGITWIKQNTDLIAALSIGLGVAAAAYGVYWVATNTALIATKAITAAQWLWNLALTANPIGIVVVAIGALVASMVYAWYNMEKFRGFVLGLWEVMKTVFTNLKTLIMQAFGGFADLLEGIFTFDTDKIKTGLKALGKTLIQTTPVGLAATLGKGVGESFTKGYSEGVAQVKKRKEDKKAGEAEATATAATATGAPTGLAALMPKPAKTKTDKIGSAIGEATGTKQTHITISMRNLVENFEVNSINVKEGASKVKDEITKLLLTALNDANAAVA